MDINDLVSPLDYRYYGGDKELFTRLNTFVSENSFIRYQLLVEYTLVETMADIGICSREVAQEVKKACEEIKLEEIFEEERVTHHYSKAIVNCISNKVSEKAKPYIHLFVTSFDILDTATALRFKDLTKEVIIPDLMRLEKALIAIARQSKNAVQIGRTHGQHAEPVTFGYWLAGYVSRIGKRIEKIKKDAEDLRGKISGSVGAYNTISLITEEYKVQPDEFEKLVLEKLGLKPADHSTQIVQPEYLTDLVYSVTSCFSILANLCDDIRNLRRSEIDEIIEVQEDKSIGSSTMPHKVNPWNFEHVKSMWKEFMPRITTSLMDQISEHQRDLTNSSSGRFLTETFVAFIHSVNRLINALKKIRVNYENLKRNLDFNKDIIIAEPLYILLSLKKYPYGYSYVRKLLKMSRETGRKLIEIIYNDKEIKPFIDKMSSKEKEILNNPEKYTGIAEQKTEEICNFWEKALSLEQ